MFLRSSRRQFVFAMMLAAGAGLSWAAIGEAGKPGAGDGGAPAGRIFYSWSTAINPNAFPDPAYEPLGFWSMNADGSDKQLLPYQPSSSGTAQLSHQIHQGHRWFLEFGPSPTPGNGAAAFAVRDDGDPDYTVLLADPPGLSLQHFRWSKDDSFVSIAAIAEVIDSEGRRGYDPNAVAHIYAVLVSFDPVTGLPALVTPFLPVADGETPGYPDIESHDWSADGSQIVYQQQPNGGQSSAKIADIAGGAPRVLAADAWNPVWSPDGAHIAYKLFDDGIRVVNPDGTGLVAITSFAGGRGDLAVGWSLDSKHVLINRLVVKSIKGGYVEYHNDVLRVPAGGGKAVNLTSDIDGYAEAAYWR